MVLDEPPPIDGIPLFFTAEFLRVVRPSLVARVWRPAVARRSFPPQRFFAIDLSIRAVS